MMVGIIAGIVMGVLLWQTPVVGAILGGVAGWLVWKVVGMEAAMKVLQRRMQQFPVHDPQQQSDEDATGSESKGVPSHTSDTVSEEAPAPISPDMSPVNVEIHQTVEKIAPEVEISHPSPSNDPQEIQTITARLAGMLTWFSSGNMLVRVGSVVLLFGAGFLLKYAADHSQLSIEIRMMGVVLGAFTMLGFGWYLRSSRPTYALALQGGGLGLLYLTIFASFRLYDLLAAPYALILLAAVSGVGVAMSIIFNARWLAILSFAGGFMAPILASTGTGGHVALFSWYAVLNTGIAALAWYKAWRSLNLLGMVSTFIIAALWGSHYYHSAFFDSVEPFLIGFGLLYLAIGVLFSLHRADPEQEAFGRVDASIIFGTPVGFFLLQTPLVHDFEHGMSLSAFLAGLVYAGISRLAGKQENKTLMVALLSIAVTLITLAIPLEFDEAQTAAAWAMEGVGLLWLGLVQKSARARLTGLVLQGLAAGSWIFGSPFLSTAGYGSTLSIFLIAISGWFCAVLLNKYENPEHDPSDTAYIFQLWGLFWWLGAGLTELHRHFHGYDLLLFAMGWITLSAWLVEGLGLRCRWRQFRHLNAGLIVLWCIGLLNQGLYVEHPMQGWGLLAWMPALLTTYWMLYRDDKRQMDSANKEINSPFHVLNVCFLLLFLIWELHWQMAEWLSKPMGIPLWANLAPGLVAGLLLMAISSGWNRWPTATCRSSYLRVSSTICILVIAVWFAWILQDPVHIGMPYLPLINPPDLVFILAVLAIYKWWKVLQEHELVWFKTSYFYLMIGFAVFMLFNADVARVVHHWFGIAWQEHDMMYSVELQTGLSLSWSALALVLMSWASKKGWRWMWIDGAALLGVVVIKLFIIDMSGSGTLARIVSFLGVGGLLLIIGYLSPLPPESEKPGNLEDTGSERKAKN